MIGKDSAPNFYSGNGGASEAEASEAEASEAEAPAAASAAEAATAILAQVPPALQSAAPRAPAMKTEDFARKAQEKPGDLEKARGKLADENLGKSGDAAGAESRAQVWL